MSDLPLAKPLKGAALLARRDRRSDAVKHERHEMDAAKRRDRNVCRWPKCEFAKKGLAIHAAHLWHRGAGGNPDGTRTKRNQLIALCARHHQLLDHADLSIVPLTEHGTDGPCDFGMRINGEMQRWAIERTHLVSERRG